MYLFGADNMEVETEDIALVVHNRRRGSLPVRDGELRTKVSRLTKKIAKTQNVKANHFFLIGRSFLVKNNPR